MKRLLFVCFVAFSLVACQFVEEDSFESPSPSSATITPSNSASFSVSSNSEIYTVDASVASVTLSGDISGKNLYYAMVNTSSNEISGKYVRYIVSQNARSAAAVSSTITHDTHFHDDEEFFTCHHEDDITPVFSASSARAAASEPARKAHRIEEVPFESKKTFFLSEYKDASVKKSATLYAVNEICNVWIVDDEKHIPQSKRKEVAETYAQKFAKMHPVVCKVFGKESDLIYVTSEGDFASMNEFSETGTKVNIVMYDLYNDGISGKVIGMFSNRDYFKNGLTVSGNEIDSSNEGKYLYIDSYLATKNLEYTLSTIAHEFQHMINFSVKAMNQQASDSNFNEMLSMLCEDMMQEYLNVQDAYTPKNRLRRFLSHYYDAGIRGQATSLQSYSNAYAFGAWLARQYGGAALIKEMMSNGKANNECIAAAVSAIEGRAFTFDDLFQEFIAACFDGELSARNKDAPQTIRSEDGYDYPMRNINLTEITNLGETMTIFENDAITEIAPSYGIFLKTFGEIDGNTVTLSFNSDSGKTNSSLLMYIYVK